MVKIIFSKIARFDLKEIIDYIKRDSIRYVYLEKKEIEDAIEEIPVQRAYFKFILLEAQQDEFELHPHSITPNFPTFAPFHNYYERRKIIKFY